MTPARRFNRRIRTLLVSALTTTALILSPAIAAPAFAEDAPSVDETGVVDVVAPASATLDGDLRVGGVVTVASDPWQPAETQLSYAWWLSPTPYAAPVDGVDQNADAVQVEDADAVSLTLPADSLGQYVWAIVTGTLEGSDPVELLATSADPVALGVFASVPSVSLAGTAVVGSTLTAKLSAPAPAGASVAYQWLLDDAPLETATASTFALAAAVRSHAVSVRVTFSAPGYQEEPRTSGAVTVGTGAALTPPAVTLGGSVRVGSTVTAKPGTWPAGTTFTYRWRLTDSKKKTVYISGATKSTYVPTATTRGKKLSAVVTATAPGRKTSAAKASAAVTIGYGVFNAPTPKITGSAYVGATLKATAGTWSPSATLRYQWKRSGSAIRGATKSSYKLTTSDVGKKITVTVSGTRTAYTKASRTSAATGSVVRAFAKVYAPTISGTTRVGYALKASVKAWSPTATFTYQWKRNGAAISGATKSTYTLTASDLGAALSVTVTGKRSGYYSRTATSAATAKIGAPVTLTADGLYRVGTQIAPATYVATGGVNCWFERRSDENAGSDTGLLGWQYAFGDTGAFKGPKVVTISASDAYFYTEGCGTWRLASTSLKTSVKDGTWIVGKDVKAGTWEVVGPVTSSCVILYLGSFTGDPDQDVIDAYDAIETGDWYSIFPTDKGFVTSGCGTWKRVGN